jgi:hypothetical protein
LAARRFNRAPRAIYTLLLMMLAGILHPLAQPGFGTPVLDNERVKVWDVTLTPGQPASMDHHGNDFLTLFFVGGEIQTTYSNDKPSVATRNFGEAVFGHKGTTETEQVLSNGAARLIVIELKNNPVPALVNKSGYPPAFPRPGSKKILENDRVVVWNYTYKPGVKTPMHYHDKDAVVVYKYDGTLESITPDGKIVSSDDKGGEVKFTKGDRTHYEVLSKGQETVIVTELK